jgi:DNA (cytosine-5)-methyltransferase 1
MLSFIANPRYQVSWAILHSGFYGTPQNRRRVIYWAARQGHIIPRFPLPSHTFAHQVQLFSKLPIGGKSSIVVRPCGGAPHRGINAEQAIDDLPGFDW